MWWILIYLLEKNKGLLPNWTYRQSAKFLQCGIRWGWSVWKLWALNVCVIETDGLTSVGAKLASNCFVWKLCLLIFGILKKKKKKVMKAFEDITCILGQQALLRIFQGRNIRQYNDHHQKLHLGGQQNLNYPPKRAPNRFKCVLSWQHYSWNQCDFILSSYSQWEDVTQSVFAQLMGFTVYII